MPTPIKESELTFHDPVLVDFPLSNEVSADVAQKLMKHIIATQWPSVKRATQCVYVVRVRGHVSISYPNGFSPVLYIGEGDAYSRLQTHAAEWLTELAVSIPQLVIEIKIVEVARKAKADLYRHIEADLIRWFSEENGTLPWRNKQYEVSMEGGYEYSDNASKALRSLISIGAGNSFAWEIKPTKNNSGWDAYSKG
jgi:hypothetical protein